VNKTNIAVIGTGRMGSVHVRDLVRKIPEANLVALCDIRLDVAQDLAGELGIARVVRDYHELLADRTIPAVLIATSTDTHAMIVTDAARAGKHIFCEKPLALDLANIDATLAAVDTAGVKLQVGFNRRFDPASELRRHRLMSNTASQSKRFVKKASLHRGIATDSRRHAKDACQLTSVAHCRVGSRHVARGPTQHTSATEQLHITKESSAVARAQCG
jgi:hypothetical protein